MSQAPIPSAFEQLDVFPRPAQVLLGSSDTRSALGFPTFTGAEAEAADAFARLLVRAPVADPGRPAEGRGGEGGMSAADMLAVHCEKSSDPALARDSITGVRHNEGYELVRRGRDAELRFTGVGGLRNGVATLAQLLDRGELPNDFVIRDSPRFAIRGLIEGYYGRPWTDEQRRSNLREGARRKLNAYFYGPKDDPFHRSRWRDPYPPEQERAFTDLVYDARSLGIETWYTIGPGLSMEYSSRADRRRLAEKIGEVARMGIRSFGLLFDDIPLRLQHVSDTEKFGTVAEAHASVANELFEGLLESDRRARLAVCPTEYSGNPSGAYISELGERLDPRIKVFWTGPEICSREISLNHAAELERTLYRPFLLWDNYPVNDLEMRYELHLGPYRGRDPQLYRAAEGAVANAMERAEAGKVGLLTAADYLWNPDAYEPEESLHSALRCLLGEADYADFLPFADCNRFSALYASDAPKLSRALEEISFLRETGRPDRAQVLLGEEIAEQRRALELFDRGLANERLQEEVAPWIEKYRKGLEVLELARRTLEVEASSPGRAAEESVENEQGRRQARRILSAYRDDPHYTFADVLYFTVEELTRRYE